MVTTASSPSPAGNRWQRLLPGLALGGAVTAAAFLLRSLELPGLTRLSPLMLAIMIGMLVRNTLGRPEAARAGLAFSLRGLWLIFEKAGVEGWKAVIPVYHHVILTRLAGLSAWWTLPLLLVLPFLKAQDKGAKLLCLFLLFLWWGWLCQRIAKRFGKGVGFGLGLTIPGTDLYFRTADAFSTTRDATEKVAAGYAQGQFRAGPLGVLGGVRAERTEVSGFGYVRVRPATAAQIPDPVARARHDWDHPVRNAGSYTRPFPSIHLTWNFTPNLRAQGSWSTSFGRPPVTNQRYLHLASELPALRLPGAQRSAQQAPG